MTNLWSMEFGGNLNGYKKTTPAPPQAAENAPENVNPAPVKSPKNRQICGLSELANLMI